MIVWISAAIVGVSGVGVLGFGAIIVREHRRQRDFLRKVSR